MIDSNREEFEKLPEIAERLHTVFYNEDLNQYHAAMINSGLSVKYIHGAWYAFQEQQKKLDRYRDENKDHLEHIDELQARVNDAEKWIESNRKTITLEYSGYTTEEYVDADEMMNILKGNKDETII